MAPDTQPFSSATFDALVRTFQRPRGDETRVDVTPNLLIRPWKYSDAIPTRVLLSSVAQDYPGFYEWLGQKWQDKDVSKKVVEVDNAVAAYSMWARKDKRNIKLQTFFVGNLLRNTAIGQHFLYHEIRTWEKIPEIERVLVTIASTKTELINYFIRFGFRVEGIAANRYKRPSGASELVLVKHFIRRVVQKQSELRLIANFLAERIWGIDPTRQTAARFGISSSNFSFPVSFPAVSLTLDDHNTTVPKRVRLIDDEGSEILYYDDVSLMREFYPLRLHLINKRFVIIPIYPRWVGEMFFTMSDASASHTRLKLRVDNVYYCYPRIRTLAAGDLVIFYETKRGSGRGAAIGGAIVRKVVIDAPEKLHEAFSERGVYSVEDIRKHAAKGKAMAIHFEMFEPFKRPVPLKRMQKILTKQLIPQAITQIVRNKFEQIRREGLS